MSVCKIQWRTQETMMQRRGQLRGKDVCLMFSHSFDCQCVCSHVSADAVLFSKPTQVCVWLGNHQAVHQGSMCAQMTWPRFPPKYPGATRWANEPRGITSNSWPITPAHSSDVAKTSWSMSADQDLTAVVFLALWGCFLCGPSFVHTHQSLRLSKIFGSHCAGVQVVSLIFTQWMFSMHKNMHYGEIWHKKYDIKCVF